MSSDLVSSYFGSELAKLGPVQAARGTQAYTGLVDELIVMHQECIDSAELENFLELTTAEMKARLELMSEWRGPSAKAPTGLKQVELINEYVDILGAVFDDFESSECRVVNGKLTFAMPDANEAVPEQPSDEDDDQNEQAMARAAEARRVADVVEQKREARRLRAAIEEEKQNAAAKHARGDNQALRDELAQLRAQNGNNGGGGRSERADALVNVLGRSADSLGLNSAQTAAIAELLHNEVGDVVGGGVGGRLVRCLQVWTQRGQMGGQLRLSWCVVHYHRGNTRCVARTSTSSTGGCGGP